MHSFSDSNNKLEEILNEYIDKLDIDFEFYNI